MTVLHTPLALLSLLLTGATFGFFYAWVCSTMWGLDAADPRVAIEAMQSMNASVRNAVFAPVFFGTVPVLLITAGLLWRAQNTPAALWLTGAALIALFLVTLLTAVMLIPMNEALAAVQVPDDIDAARKIWADYSPTWQFWNQVRTITSGVALLMVGIGFLQLR